MKTTLDLPEELVREMKLRAVMQRRTVKALAAELLSQALGLAPAAQPATRSVIGRVEIGDRGLPVIRCRPEAPGLGLNPKQLLELEQDTQLAEDLKRAGLSV